MPIWLDQLALVRRALADNAPLSFEEMLILRDLGGTVARPMQPPPGQVPRAAAALLLLYPESGELHLPLTLRSARLNQHAGQVSLPGGATDPDDAGPEATALREAHEELGIDPASVELLGRLTPFYIPPSNFLLSPIVGYVADVPPLRPNPSEVADVFSVSLRYLQDPANVREENWERQGVPFRVPFYAIDGHKVWGATALLLSELVARLRRADIG
ncbi:CoA pyrophosphatase [Candidatus Gracilibacteria bacterium]|nr:CoA pyrophosphatase [Candidatus Gracilibacteria bacterium]